MTCDSCWIGGFDVALSCVREPGHDTPHRNDCGTTWDDQPAPPATAREQRDVTHEVLAGMRDLLHSPACEWCGRAIRQVESEWRAVKAEERGYDPLDCEGADDARHNPSASGPSRLLEEDR